jgi:hypothetical protein
VEHQRRSARRGGLGHRLTSINYAGVSGHHNGADVAKISLVAIPRSLLRVTRVAPVVRRAPAALASFGVIMIAVMWTYEGWYYVAFAAGNHHPGRTARAPHLGTSRSRPLRRRERRVLLPIEAMRA